MSDAEEAISEEYGPRIQACERLFEYAGELMTSWPGGRIESTADGLILALFGRSLDTSTAAVRLAKVGYGAQTAMLNRSLFEDMIDIHWIATDPEAAEERYRDHDQHGRMLLADAVAKYPDHYDIELPDFDPGERKRLDGVYGRWGAKSWSGMNLHERVRAVEHHWKDDVGRQTLHFFHDIAHRENNQVLHVSSAALSAKAEVSGSGDHFTLYFGPGPKGLDRALFGSFWIFDNTIGLLIDHFEIAVDDKTRMELFSPKDFIKLSDEQIRDTGRNDPCPCGSGLKFKRCHDA